MTKTIPFSAACERNKDVILETIRPVLQHVKSVLEIGSGTGQHAVHFASALPHLVWQTSDQNEHLNGLRAQLETAKIANALPPIELDVTRLPWLHRTKQYDVVFTANSLHIMSWNTVRAFFEGLNNVTTKGSHLIIYGPFKYAGAFTSASNKEFDLSLRSRELGSAIRDFEAVDDLAKTTGFRLVSDTPMPANNQCLVFQRSTS